MNCLIAKFIPLLLIFSLVGSLPETMFCINKFLLASSAEIEANCCGSEQCCCDADSKDSSEKGACGVGHSEKPASAKQASVYFALLDCASAVGFPAYLQSLKNIEYHLPLLENSKAYSQNLSGRYVDLEIIFQSYYGPSIYHPPPVFL